MLVMALGIILFVMMYQRRIIQHQVEIEKMNLQKQQELVYASIKSEEDERKRIAAELHDDVGANLSAVRLYLYSAIQSYPEQSEIILQARELLDENIQKVRNISHKLQPSILTHLGLQASLQSFATMMDKSGGIKMSYYSEQELPDLEENVSLYIYRIIQELTTNVNKHANADEIWLETKMIASEKLQVLLKHNGQGLSHEGFEELIYKKGSIGLKNIVNRIQLLNASLRFSQNQEDQTFQIEIIVPTNKL